MLLFKEIQTLDENINEEIKSIEINNSDQKSESSTNIDEIFQLINS